MAKGAEGNYWEKERLPGVLKLDLLRQYAPVFLGRLGAHGDVEYIDGYAGAGRYKNGSEGSPMVALKAARAHLERHGHSYRIHLFEKDPIRFAALDQLVEEFRASGVDVHCKCSDVATGLDAIIDSAENKHLFAFLDPCGIGVTYSQILRIANRGQNRTASELLMNLSMGAIRRIGGRLANPDGPGAAKTLQRLDDALGGPEWRSIYQRGGPDPAESVVRYFTAKLARDTSSYVVSIPVRRKPADKPLYYLIFATRRADALLIFSDAHAKAQEKYRMTLTAESSSQPQLALDGLAGLETGMPALKQLEEIALPALKSNLEKLIIRVPGARVGDYSKEILGEHIGQVRETVIRKAVKELHREGVTSSDGKGRIRDLRLLRA